jgi:hypothetical protein
LGAALPEFFKHNKTCVYNKVNMEGLERFFSGSVPLNLSVPMIHAPHFPTTSYSPQLAILSQRTHSEEIVSKNGIQKTLHIVVKNSPFHFQLGIANANVCKIDFNQIAFDAQLLYDCEGDKEVDFVKVKPMEFKASASEVILKYLNKFNRFRTGNLLT